MIKHIFLAILSVVLVRNACDAQPMLTSTNWGQSIYGVRISIDTITNAFSPASMIVVNAQIENTSTNVVTVRETASRKDFSVWLEDASGKKYLLTDNTKPISEDRNFIKKIRPGETDAWQIRLIIRKEIESSVYTLKTTRKVKLKGVEFVIESNPLKIQIENL